MTEELSLRILISIMSGMLVSFKAQDSISGVITAVVIFAGIILYENGTMRRVVVWLEPKMTHLWGWFQRMTTRQEAAIPMAPYTIVIGHDPIMGVEDVETLGNLGHVGVYGTTRYGKTTWIHSFIHQLIKDHNASELRLCISDPKTVDYPFYGSLPHLLCPIARDTEETIKMVEAVIGEMNRRIGLFSPYAAIKVCNNLDRYIELSGNKLPRIVVIFDELADVVESGSELEDKIIRLAKLGLAYGINLVCATQRPSAKVVTGEIKSQMASKMVTWMPSSREYGVVAELPKDLYQDMQRTPGRFMVYSVAGWRFVQGVKIPDRQLEAMAARKSGKRRRWASESTDTQQTAVSAWSRDEAHNIRLIQDMKSDLGRWPSISEMMTRFNVSKPTVIKYRDLAGYEK